MRYTNHFNPNNTPQSEPIPFSGQVQNNAGGYAWQIDKWKRLERFLILGTEGGTYYTTERSLTVENAESAVACLEEDPRRVVETLLDISRQGRALKNGPALFVLAMACSPLAVHSVEERAFALGALPLVARTPTHLFEFLEYVQDFRGWGRGLRRAVAEWYNHRSADVLAYHMVKYRQRNGWTNMDALRLAHPKASTEEHDIVYRWVVGKGRPESLPENVRIIEGFEKIQRVTDPSEAASLIREYSLPREALPTSLLTEEAIWKALLPNMPVMALVRNLSNMARVGLIGPGRWENNERVVKVLNDPVLIRASRIHPFQILMAMYGYGRGESRYGRGEWLVSGEIKNALEQAYYAAFENVKPTGKRICIGLDVSGSMSQSFGSSQDITCRDASAALSMITVRTEPRTAVLAFEYALTPLDIGRQDSLEQVIHKVSNLRFGTTDCSLPMRYAYQHRLEFDAFVIYTDNETWAGPVHPAQALAQYREKMGIDAKLVVVGMESNGFSIADPSDPGMLDVVGFDANTPQVISEFISL
ncbi:MAG TPA: TROVE domain-containing protein [Bellilinea sp.]|nr:TROVE domain-containing protein [Bellilinea sp.]